MTIVHKPQSRNPWLLGLVGGAIALSLTVLGIVKLAVPTSEKLSSVKTEPVATLPQRIEVVALGRLEPQDEVVRVGGSTGERIQHLTVKEGDRVQKGAILGYLESYAERLAERNYAASQLDEAKQRLKAATD